MLFVNVNLLGTLVKIINVRLEFFIDYFLWNIVTPKYFKQKIKTFNDALIIIYENIVT